MPTAFELGRAALAEADWEVAKGHFEEALSLADTAEVRDGLGYALWWTGDVMGGLREWERAYVASVDGGNRRMAGRLALLLSGQSSSLGNEAAARGWEKRAEHLLADVEPCAERVRLIESLAAREPDPRRAAAMLEEGIEMARAIGNPNVEIHILSECGRALVAAGLVDEGFARLDEAMARTMAGELKDDWLVASASCNMLKACDLAYDLPRAAEWCKIAEAWARHRGCLPFFAFCRISYGAVLFARGRWADAEDQLVDAVRRYEDTYPAMCAYGLSRLAELRIAQGRLEDADELLAPFRDHPACTIPAALVGSLRNEPEAALSRVERRIAVVSPDPSRLAPLYEALAEIHLRRRDVQKAHEAARRLASIAETQRSRMLTAMADATLGVVGLESGNADALTHLSRAHAAYLELEMPYRAARAELAVAKVLARTRREAAESTAKAALSVFEELGAALAADEAGELLRALSGVRPALKRRAGPELLTNREEQVLALIAEGLSNPLIAERLDISPKTAEHHACNILSKLGVSSRAAAAAWVARRDKKKLP